MGVILADLLEHGLDLLDRVRGLAPVDDGMTVRADRTKIADWVYAVGRSDGGEWSQMMDVDEAGQCPPIDLFEVEAAHDAPGAIVLDALRARFRVTLITVDPYPNDAAFDEGDVRGNLLWGIRGGPRWRTHNTDVARDSGDPWFGHAHVLADAQIRALPELVLGSEQDVAVAVEEGSGEALQLMVPVPVMDVERMGGPDTPLLIEVSPCYRLGHRCVTPVRQRSR
jgi:hypothetical protein